MVWIMVCGMGDEEGGKVNFLWEKKINKKGSRISCVIDHAPDNTCDMIIDI